MKTVENIGLPRGTKRKTTKEIDNAIIDKIQHDRKKPSRLIQKDIEKEFGVSVSSRLVRRRLNDHGFYSVVVKKKPLVKNVHRLKRLGYSYSYSAKSFKFWDREMWSDEAKFDLFNSRQRKLAWVRRGESLSSNYFTPNVQQGCGSLLVWGCMSKKGIWNLVFIQENKTGTICRSILVKNLYESAKNLGISKQLVLMHDNDSKHRWQIVLYWIHSRKIETLPWPPHSPDLNPIERVWALMKR